MKTLSILLITSSLLFANYTTVKNGKVVHIPNNIGFEGTIISIITIEDYRLAKMQDDKGNIIRGRFYKNQTLERNDRTYITCNTYNGLEYEHCY